MRRPWSSWSCEVARTFLRYLAVGGAFVPAGLVYALAAVAGWGHWVVASVCLGVGFLMAHILWRKTERWEVRTVRHDQVTSQGAETRFSFRQVPWLQMPTSSSLGERSTNATIYVVTPPLIEGPRISQGQSAEAMAR